MSDLGRTARRWDQSTLDGVVRWREDRVYEEDIEKAAAILRSTYEAEFEYDGSGEIFRKEARTLLESVLGCSDGNE